MIQSTDGMRKIPNFPVYQMVSIEKFHLTAGESRSFAVEDLFGLLILTKGCGKIADQLMLIKSGESVLIRSTKTLEVCSDCKRISGYYIVFSSTSCNTEDRWMSVDQEDFQNSIRVKPAAKFLTAVASMYDLTQQIETNCEPLQLFKIQLAFQTLLYQLFSVICSISPEEDSVSAVRRSIEYLQSHYHEEYTVAQLASQVNLSSRQYTRLFKKLTGKTPNAFLNEYRINRSKEMLLQTEEPSHRISSKIGMKDVNYFNRRFKQMVGCSPKEYVRKRYLDSRIVTLHYAGEMLALGMQPLGSLESSLQQLQTDVPNIASIGTYNVEFDKLKALQPDLVITSDFIDRKDLMSISEFAPVIVIPWDMDAFERLYRVARVLGKEKEAEEWRKLYENKKEEVLHKCKDILPQDETANIIRLEENKVWVHATRFFPTFYKVIGFQPSKLMRETTEMDPNQRRVDIPIQHIKRIDADRLYIVDNDHAMFNQFFAQVQSNKDWQALRAVQKGRVYKLSLRGISYSAYTLMWQLQQIPYLLNPACSQPHPDPFITCVLGSSITDGYNLSGLQIPMRG